MPTYLLVLSGKQGFKDLTEKSPQSKFPYKKELKQKYIQIMSDLPRYLVLQPSYPYMMNSGPSLYKGLFRQGKLLDSRQSTYVFIGYGINTY